MARPPVARLTAAEGRAFGLPVGGAFLLMAVLLAWRNHVASSRLAGVLGVALTLAALTIPTHLGPMYRRWMGLAGVLSKVTTPVFLGIIYFLVITPIGFLLRLLGRNPMHRRASSGSYWVDRTESSRQRSDLARQF